MTAKEFTAAKLQFFDALVADSRLSGTAVKVAWCLLSRFLNGDEANNLYGHAWPCQLTLATELNISEKSVRVASKRLEEYGWFVRTRERVSRDCRNWQYVYQPNWQRLDTEGKAEQTAAYENGNTPHSRNKRAGLKAEQNGQERRNERVGEFPLRNPIIKNPLNLCTISPVLGSTSSSEGENEQAEKNQPEACQANEYEAKAENDNVTPLATSRQRERAANANFWYKNGLSAPPSSWTTNATRELLELELISEEVALWLDTGKRLAAAA